MVEIKFGLLRVLVDVLCAVILFFGVLCTIHYGTQLAGLYFVSLRVLLGIAGTGLSIRCYSWLRRFASALIKSGSIYAQCNDDCDSVSGAFSGVISCLGSTVKVFAFNKLIREALSEIIENITADGSQVPAFIASFRETKFGSLSEKIAVKAFDYIDECILGYCYRKQNKEKGVARCALEAFVLFVSNSAGIAGQVVTTVALEFICKAAFWVVFVLACLKTFKFSILNALMCFAFGKGISFVLDDAVFEPLLMHNIIAVFSSRVWTADLEDAAGDVAGSLAPLKRIQEMWGGQDAPVTGGEEDGSTEEVREN